MGDVTDLGEYRHAKTHGGWFAEPQVCEGCGNRHVARFPGGAASPMQCPQCGAMACVRDVGPPEGPAQADPYAPVRAQMVADLTALLRAVQAGQVDGMFLIVHDGAEHPDGPGWRTCYTGNVDFVTRLGGLELAKADMIARAGRKP